jgi:hypothetical protein
VTDDTDPCSDPFSGLTDADKLRLAKTLLIAYSGAVERNFQEAEDAVARGIELYEMAEAMRRRCTELAGMIDALQTTEEDFIAF